MIRTGVSQHPSGFRRIISRIAVSGPDNERIGGGLPRGLKIYFAAGIGVFLVAMHISMHLTSHSLHHGH
jgi:hypothetical protein